MGPQRTLVNFWLIIDLKHTKPHFHNGKNQHFSISLRILSPPLTIKVLCPAFFATTLQCIDDLKFQKGRARTRFLVTKKKSTDFIDWGWGSMGGSSVCTSIEMQLYAI
jgi:hypothetical protein